MDAPETRIRILLKRRGAVLWQSDIAERSGERGKHRPRVVKILERTEGGLALRAGVVSERQFEPKACGSAEHPASVRQVKSRSESAVAAVMADIERRRSGIEAWKRAGRLCRFSGVVIQQAA